MLASWVKTPAYRLRPHSLHVLSIGTPPSLELKDEALTDAKWVTCKMSKQASGDIIMKKNLFLSPLLNST